MKIKVPGWAIVFRIFKLELGASAASALVLMSKHLTIQKAEDLWKVVDSDGRFPQDA